ncbi:Uncharacterized protein GBIM_09513 [Gryllus bimaculatus]|nr:Uncharacterized protein GBIM_09513 [Gryllus bimaculatus]
MDQRFCITTGVPPRLAGFWEIGQLRRYGVVEGRFCFEGGSRCGRGEGLHVCVTDQGEEITGTFQLAAQGKLAARRRPAAAALLADQCCNCAAAAAGGAGGDGGAGACAHASRHPSAEDLLCPCSSTSWRRLHHGSTSPFWSSAESAAGQHNADLDSNYGCGDTASVSDLHHEPFHAGEGGWGGGEGGGGAGGGAYPGGRGLPPALERCASCISKLGAPSMSRSSTATNTNTPTAGMVPFSPAWTMDGGPSPQSQPPPQGPMGMPLGSMPVCHMHYPRASSSCDRSSVSSHSSSSGGTSSEYCVPRFSAAPDCWYDRPRPMSTAGTPHLYHGAPPTIPPKSPKTPSSGSQGPGIKPLPPAAPCSCCPPSRPPKPPQMNTSNVQAGRTSDSDSPSKKKVKKPPMPLPLSTTPAPVSTPNTGPVCLCHHYPGVVLQQPMQQAKHDSVSVAYPVGPYENYDVPKSLLGGTTYPKEQMRDDAKQDEQRMSISSQQCDEYYDTPKNLKDCLGSPAVSDLQYGNYDTPPMVKTLRKPCGCIIKYTTKKSVVITSQIETSKMVSEHEEITTTAASCPCQRVMCWAENWMMLPYCRRGNGMENTGVPIHKVKLSGEGKMPVVNASGEIAIYATVDKSKKTNRRLTSGDQQQETGPIESQVSPDVVQMCPKPDSSNYVNVEPTAEGVAISTVSQDTSNATQEGVGTNYENIDFAQSLEYYENAKDVLQRAGISQQEAEAIAGEFEDARNMSEDPSLSYTINNGVKYCNKCGHACHIQQASSTQHKSETTTPEVETDSNVMTVSALTESSDASSNRQDDYLMMEPTKHLQNEGNKNFPGYLPMSPITNANTTCNKLKVDQGLPSEKSASIPSLTAPVVDRSRKRSDSEFPRVPGSAMMMMHHSANSPYLRRLLMDTADDTRRTQMLTRKRSSSADSSRYLDGGCDDFDSGLPERPISSSQTKLTNPEPTRKTSAPTPPVTVSETDQQEVSQRQQVSERPVATEVTSAPVAGEAPVATEEETDSGSASSGSLRTLVRESGVLDGTQGTQPSQNEVLSPSSVHIRRSSSVPCKGNNRDSSSSNDSGVSTGSLRQRGADFAEFELPLTTAMSARRHHHALAARHPGALCLHASLPRRSKSVDPLRELSFQFQKIKIPAKSSSAEAEVPICPAKRDGTKGFQSPGGDGAMVVPYMDSRSTSSGTSDMSDYIETLSLSSHSSSDTPDSLRLGRPATTTLRPRSGKEYQLIDRSILEGDLKAHCPGPAPIDKGGHQLRGLVAPYANITPVPEKSESPSPGYMSGSPGQEREDQPLIPHAYPK